MFLYIYLGPKGGAKDGSMPSWADFMKQVNDEGPTGLGDLKKIRLTFQDPSPPKPAVTRKPAVTKKAPAKGITFPI
jgi:hypothetical protein